MVFNILKHQVLSILIVLENFYQIKIDQMRSFFFQDENKWLSLRYDLTAPLARYVAKNYLEIAKPFKRYQLEQFGETKNQGLEI